MIISKIVKEKWGNNYTLEFENGENHTLSLEQILKYKLEENKDIDYLKFIDIMNEENQKRAFSKALDYLTLKDYTAFEIKNKLQKKGYSSDIIETTLEKLFSYNFLNDEKYANNYLNYAQKYKKQGKNKILFDLKQKGISNSILSNLDFDLEDQINMALKLGEKKLKTLNIEDKIKTKEKLLRYLLSKGYPHNVCFKVVSILII